MWPFKKKQPVFCKDCVHFRPDMDKVLTMHKCHRKSYENLITGEITTEIQYCEAQRQDYRDRCGPSGKYFKRKEEVV